jgi:hypothetical protein
MTATIPTSEELHAAARHGNLNRVKLLIDNGVNLDEQDKYGMTALMYAARHSNGIVSLLIEKGANLDIRNGHGKTAAEWADEGGINGIAEEERVKMLRKASQARQLAAEKAVRDAAKAEQAKISTLHNTASERQDVLKKIRPKMVVRLS